MSGLQTIIDNASGMTIDRRKVVGMQITKNEIPRLSTTPTKNPWQISLDMPPSFIYSDARALMEAIDTLDQTGYQDITFSNNACLSWIFAYQGALTLIDLNTITVTQFVGNVLELNVSLISEPASTIIFKPNDLIQIGTHPYPFTVTQEVLRGSNTTVTMTMSRPNIISAAIPNSTNITVGNTCTFRMFCPNMPVYKLIPGGYAQTAGVTTSNARIEWSNSFDLYEYVGTS
jgi:hypothetical protein